MSASLPINSNIQDGETGVNIYGYTPWLSLGVLSCIIFGIGLIAHISYAIYVGLRSPKYDKHSARHVEEENGDKVVQPLTLSPALRGKQIVTFEVLFSFGCVLEVIGYANRAVSSQNPFLLINFILQYFMIVVAPVFFSASQYLALSILLQKHTSWSKLLPLSGKMIITIFVIADVLTIILQIAGAALIGVAESNIADGIKPPLTPEQANDILRAGLAIQVFFITIFLSILCFLIFRLINSGTYKETARTWQEKAILSILTSSTFFIYLRTVYRLAEAAVGVESGPTLNQPLFAALETVPVFVAVIAWTVLPIHTLL